MTWKKAANFLAWDLLMARLPWKTSEVIPLEPKSSRRGVAPPALDGGSGFCVPRTSGLSLCRALRRWGEESKNHRRRVPGDNRRRGVRGVIDSDLRQGRMGAAPMVIGETILSVSAHRKRRRRARG